MSCLPLAASKSITYSVRHAIGNYMNIVCHALVLSADVTKSGYVTICTLSVMP